jgi:DNA-binding GntR family transcriptional regulator
MTEVLRDQMLSTSENISQEIARLLRGAILAGELEPGQRIKEEQIAQELGVSRTPVREAFLLLKSEGLIEMPRNRGARVRSYDPIEAVETYEIRAQLEGFAAHRAAENMSDATLDELEASCDRFEELCEKMDVTEIGRENMFFHHTILSASGNTRLITLVRDAMQLPLVYTSYVWQSPERRKLSVKYHRNITKALRARDGERAEQLMREHTLETRDAMVSAIASAQWPGNADDG